MEFGKLLSRQLRKHWGIQTPEDAVATLEALAQFSQQSDVLPSAQKGLANMAKFLTLVDDCYQQMERDLVLSQRSLDVSSAELTAFNQKLRDESLSIQHAASSLRQSLDQLTAGLDLQPVASAPEPDATLQLQHTQSDLHTIAQRMAQLAKAHEQSRQELRLSEQRLSLAVQGANIGLWDWNLSTDQVHYSDEWARILGFDPAEITPNTSTLIKLLHPDDAVNFFAAAAGNHLHTLPQETFRSEVRVRCKNGQYKWLEFKGRVVDMLPDGTPYRAAGVSIDVSERKAYEEAIAKSRDAAEKASRVKGDFLANMSHEIRTPMNGILGLTELCLSTQLSSEQRNYLDMVQGSAKALLTVINDILDFSKIEANKLDIEAIPFDLSQLVRNTLAPLHMQAQSKDLKLQADMSPHLPAQLMGDPGRLRQVLLNLVGNAVKFTEKGQVTLCISAVEAPSLPGAKAYRFSVKDTGIGIAADRLSQVFDAFSQADTSISRRFGGTGLGLTISAKLVELMGSKLKVRSDLGQGTEFWFDMALATAQTTTQDAAQTIALPPTKLNVLVAEDHPVNQVVARKVLEFLGHHVTMVDNGLKAVHAVGTQRFDLIFMDIQMPELDGFAATQRIREREEQTGGRIPIVAMTAHAMQGYREECLASGMDGYVTKPIDRKQLMAEIDRVMQALPHASDNPDKMSST